jgi:hypothetical protein
MARLNKEESLALARVFVRAQNSIKGTALDCLRMAMPAVPGESDRQFNQVEKTVKDKESSIRGVFLKAMVDAGVIEELTNEEIFNSAMK